VKAVVDSRSRLLARALLVRAASDGATGNDWLDGK